MRRTLTIIAFCALLLISVGVRAQSRQGRGAPGGGGGNSASAQGIASATIVAPVTIRILHWPEDFSFGPNTAEHEGSSQIFSVGGAPDFAISITVPNRAALNSPNPQYGSIEVTGIRNSTPEKVAFKSSEPNELRFGLLVNPPSDIEDPSSNERGAYVGSCRVTVNYN